MKKWMKILLSLFLVIGIIIIITVYNLNPSHHFTKQNIPTLAQPSQTKTLTSKNSTKQSIQIISTNNDLKNKGVEDKKAVIQKTTKVVKKKNNDLSFNVLILGIDTAGINDSRSDVIMVAHVLPLKHKVNLISVPRDTRVYLPGIGYTKINHAHFVGEFHEGNHGGTEKAIQAVSDFLNIPINYYIKTNFTGVTNFINQIGGLDVNLPQRIHISPINDFPKGKQHLNGAQLLLIARERYTLKNGDFGRQRNQALILQTIAKKLLQPSYIPKLPGLYQKVKKDVVDTNFTEKDLISLAWTFKGFNDKDLHYFQVPGKSDYAMDPLIKLRLYYWIPDQEQLQKIIQTYF